MKLIKKNNDYYCNECMMRQFKIKPYCNFCGKTFTNYEEVCIELYKDSHPLEDNNGRFKESN